MVDQDFPTLPGQGQGRKERRRPADEGIIAIQVHAGYPKMRVEYKDIKFTDLGEEVRSFQIAD